MINDSIKDLCRICVERSEDYIRIYDEVVPDQTPFFYIINDVCQLDISENDGFPEYICKDCFLKISEFMIFKRKSHDAKLNFLNMTVSLAEASPSKNGTGLENEEVMATSIIVKEMTAEGMTLDVTPSIDILEEVITMPFVVDYEEVVTDEPYVLGEEQTYTNEVVEEVSPRPSSPAPVIDRKRNSKEREVAIILANGGNALLNQEKEKEAVVEPDTGQEETEKVLNTRNHEEENLTKPRQSGQEEKEKVLNVIDDEEENLTKPRRSFVAQSYYLSYLLEKERKEGEKSLEEAAEDCTSISPHDSKEEGDVGEVEEAPGSPHTTSDDVEPKGVSPVTVETPQAEEEVIEDEGPGVVVEEPVAEESPTNEDTTPKAVCPKKKMLAISKSRALMRTMEQFEKATKLGSDLDVLVEACGSREENQTSVATKTPVSRDVTHDLPGNVSSQSEIIQSALVLGGDKDGTHKRRTKRRNSNDIWTTEDQEVSSKGFSKNIARADRRGAVPGPRFKIPGSDPVPPKKIKKEAPTSDGSQGIKIIQVITSEELRAKQQQLGLEQVGDILKTSLSGKNTIQVSEVGPTGNVFHVEPTIVKLKGMSIGQHSLSSPRNADVNRSGPTTAVKSKGVVGESENGDIASAISIKLEAGSEKHGNGRTGANSKEVPLTPKVSMATDSISLLGKNDGTPKTLLLTASNEENSGAPALAIFLRPLKHEEPDEEMADPVLEIDSHAEGSRSLQKKEEEGSCDLQQAGRRASADDPETFCNGIRRRAKKAMLGCIKKTLDELERMQGMGEEEEKGEEEYEPLILLSEDEEKEKEAGEEEKQQLEAVEPDTIYTCAHCGQSSYSKAEMGQHMRESHENDQLIPEYYCAKCNRHFLKRYLYRLHMEMHGMVHDVDEGEDAGAAAVSEEERTVVSPGPIQEEELSTPFRCRFCDLEFSGRSSLLFHEASKHQASPLFPCSLCPRKFLSEAKKEAHQRLCCGNRLECEICHKEYNIGSIAQHMRTHRGEKPYLCAECGKTFSQKGDLKRHTRQIHLGLEPLKPFLCSYCPKTFSAQSKLRIHERSHTKEKPYECEECGKGFAHLSTLRKHRENREFACLPVIKQAAKPYTCSICKKGWDHKYALTKHIAWVHERKRPSRTFPCPYCPKVYYCRSQLTYHLRTHTKEKPFACGMCDKSFMYNSVRKTHMEKEHGLKRSINDGSQ